MATARPHRPHKVATCLSDAELAALDRAVAEQHTTRSDLARRLVLAAVEECCDLFDAEAAPAPGGAP